MQTIYKKSVILFITILLFSSVSNSQFLPTLSLNGKLISGGQELTIMYRFTETGEGLKAKLYVPEQLLFGFSASKAELTGDLLRIEIDRLDAAYIGTVDYYNGIVEGKHIQQGVEYDLNLEFVSDEDAVQFNRPQEPKEPFDYVIQEHLIRDNRTNVGINGTLTLPNKLDKFPLVILIHGSGPQDRNQTIAGHKPFLVIADYLTKKGIAVFRYDKRGVGKSSGNYNDATSEDFANDVLSIIRYFKIHKNIDTRKIGLIGHSEGGLIAMKVAARNRRDIAFIISLAGQGVNGAELLQQQMKDILISQGKREEYINKSMMYQKALFALALESNNMTEMREGIIELQEKYQEKFSEKLSEEELEEMGIAEKYINQTIMQISSKWMKYYLQVNPEEYLDRLRCPVLAIYGGKDLQVNAEINSKAIQDILSEKRRQYYELHVLEDLNHLLQTAETGNISEYLLIEETISPEVLKLMREFIKKDKYIMQSEEEDDTDSNDDDSVSDDDSISDDDSESD